MADSIVFTAHPFSALESLSGQPHKIVHLIRHAQGTHNLAVLNAGGVDGGLEDEYKNWAWRDARLTPFGEEQAAALKPKLEGIKIDVVLTSPLSRAIQTGLIGIPAGPPFIVEDLARERNGTHPCDKRRSRAELKADFPTLDVTTLEAEEDDKWTEAREPMETLIGRAEAMCRVLKERPEASIAVTTHNDFLQALLLQSKLILADESLRRKFGNAEHLPIILTWEDAGAVATASTITTSSAESTNTVHSMQ